MRRWRSGRSFAPRSCARRLRLRATLQEYVDTVWPKSWPRLAKKTIGLDRWIFRDFLLPRFGSTELVAIRDTDVLDLVGELRSDGYAPPTINIVISVLRKALNDAYARGLTPDVPVRNFPHEKEDKLELELSPAERKAFLGAFEDFNGFQGLLTTVRRFSSPRSSTHFAHPRRFGGPVRPDSEAARVRFEWFRRSKPLFVVALETGLARGDLLSLRWTKIDFRESLIRLPRTKTGVETVVPISRACREALNECLRRPLVGEYVFLTPAGRPYSVSTVRRYFATAKKLAGIRRRFRPHDMRHTFGSTLSSRGIPLQFIQKAMGHASVRTTERYARPNKGTLEVVRRALDEGDLEEAKSPTSDRDL